MFPLPGTTARSWKSQPESSLRRARKNRTARRCGLRVLLLLVCGISSARAEPEAEKTFDFDIPGQPADTALTEFAEQADLTLVFPGELVRGRVANELVGTYTLQEGIDLLLEGTGLVPTFRNAIVLSIAADEPPENEGGDMKATKKSGLMALLAGIFAGGAGAQEAGTRTEAEQTLPIEEIIVTGSHIRGAPNTASPILRFDRDAISRSGFATLDDFMESIPQNFGGGASQDTIGTDSAVGNNGFGSSVNLRALGPGASLVLVNGRRLAPAGNGGRFIDVSMLPMAAIERVEVLTDGASAIYGSDAVGGVVNFILRDDYEGAQTTLRYGSVTDGDLGEIQASQALGGDWDTGSTLLAYEYHRRDALYASDRDFASASDSPRSLLPEQDRHSFYANLRQDLGDRVVLSGDALYSTREAFNQNAFLGLQVNERSESDQFQVSLGADVELDEDWSLNLSTGYSEYQFDASRVETPAGTTDGELTESNVDTDVWSLDALAEGLVMELPGGGLRLAAGGSFRKENVRPVFFEQALPEREVKAVFGELFIPLFGEGNGRPGLEALELSLAARYEDYSDFGSDVTPKLGLRWSPVAGLSLRGTYGESFKAPVLTDLAPGTEALLAFIASDFGLIIEGDPLILLRAQSATPELKEEESSSYTLGFDLERDQGLSLSMTWYHIEFEGRIGTPLDGGFELFFNSPEIYGDFQVLDPDAAFVDARLAAANVFTDLTGGVFTPSTVDIWADVSVTNIAVEEQSGIDFMVSYPLETGFGSFDLSLNGTYITTFDKELAPGAPTVEALNLLNQPIDLRLRSSVIWSRDNLSAAMFVNYQDDYRNTDAESSHISSWTTVDSQLTYDFGGSARGILGGLSLSLSVQNLLDRNPPFVASQGSPIAHPGYDSTNATPLGRFVALTATKSWQ